MKKQLLSLACAGGILASVPLLSCGGGARTDAFMEANALNQRAYETRYKNLDATEADALQALQLGGDRSYIKAEALNNLAFCAFIRMDFERADSLLQEVYAETNNELECLVADVGMMKLCQRTAMNKEFYDYRNSALRRMKRIREDKEALAEPRILHRFNYACSEFSITSSVYYYYLQQEEQSLQAINEIDVSAELEGDTAQLLYYYYMRGSGGMYQADTPEGVVLGEFDYLMDCLMLSHEHGYTYFEANASQAMAELLANRKNFNFLLEKRPGMMRIANRRDLPWEELVVAFAESALKLFKEYGDWYQIAGTHRTLASCYNELGKHEIALANLENALAYVNLHHEHFYHCHDTLDRLKLYVPDATTSTELRWINAEGIKTVPEWIARLREQLSVTYAALGMKPQSDYNRNIYLDILDYTRQDKELESRYQALEEETSLLNGLLALVVGGFVSLVFLLIYLNRRWRIRNAHYVGKLQEVLDICRQITASVPTDAEDLDDVIQAVMNSVKHRAMAVVGASDMEIIPIEEGSEIPSSEGVSYFLRGADGQPLAMWKVTMSDKMDKEDKALLEVMIPYLSWTLENGLAMISLSDEHRRLSKEHYVHGMHLEENKRQNIVKKACLFLVAGITPYIDRVVNEVHKLTSFNYLANLEIKVAKYRYLDELLACINEYNEILARWIKMRQGSLSLHVESFNLAPLLEVVQKGRRNFEAKEQTLVVEPADVWVKADKALTLFMINTLMENARKYTGRGGEVKVFAREAEEYVEISVQDNGPGLSEADIHCILDEKVYDSGKIGLQTSPDAEALKKSKGSGFGLMNCKGIIESYRKASPVFRVCNFSIESRLGEGSRFYFRLPKGVQRMLMMWLCVLSSVFFGCGQKMDVSESEGFVPVDSVMEDSLLYEANHFANGVYEANLEGRYADAVLYADSALACMNAHFMKYSDWVAPMLQLVGEGASAELGWFTGGFMTDYHALLDVRNEAAVAFLALGELDAYRYNNQAYTALYKQISVDNSLEGYCTRMRLSANNKTVAIMLCFVLVVALLVGYYLLALKQRLAYRYGLEQVLEINRRALSSPSSCVEDVQAFVSGMVKDLFKELNELVSLEAMGIMVQGDEMSGKCYAFSDTSADVEALKGVMERASGHQDMMWDEDAKVWLIPLCVEVGDESRVVGQMALWCTSGNASEDDRLMLELVASYLAIVVYNAVELMAGKLKDVEEAQDENHRVVSEKNRLHVQNLVLDNCLSTIKHETLYYPNRIRQIVNALQAGGVEEMEERKQVETIAELVAYYKEIFTILSSCASRQLEEITFRRTVVNAEELVESASKYLRKKVSKVPVRLELKVQADPVQMIGDASLLKFMLESLIDEAFSHPYEGVLELHIYKEGTFVRFDFIDRRRTFVDEELEQLFAPNRLGMQGEGEGKIAGTEYLVCKQIIRDHDEYAGRRGCRMNASQVSGGGFMVWFTIPAK